MKKIFIILFSVCAFINSNAQKTLLPVQGNLNTIQHYADAIAADSVILLSVCNDTPKIDMYKYQVGGKKVTAFTVDTVSNKPKYWWHGWHEISGSGNVTPAGNYGGIQLNRNSLLAATDSFKYTSASGLQVINNIISRDISAYNSDETKSISTNAGNLQIQFNTGSASARLNANNISGVKDIALPNVNGNLASSVTVNDITYTAGTGGNINLGTISGGGSFNFDSAFNTKTTTDLAEGDNKYYTDARARDAISLNFTTTGTSGAATGTYNSETGEIDINIPQYSGGGGGGIVSVGNSDYGLIKQNDSTYKVDSTLLETRLRADKVRDSLGALIATKLNTSTAASTYQALSQKVTTLDSSNTNYPSTSAVKKELYEKVDKDSISELTTDTHLSIAPDGDDTKISLDNITGMVAGSAVSGTGTSADPYTINTQTTITGNAGTATKLATGRTLSITGDLAWTSPSFDGSGNVTAAGTLATVNSNVGSFTNANITVNAKGLITAASNGNAITPSDTSVFLRKNDSLHYVTPTALAAIKPSNPKFTGIEYYRYSNFNINDFTDNTMSATISSGNIAIPDANVSDFTKYLTLDSITCVNHWKMIMLFKRTANPGGGGSGISLGIKSINSDADCSNAVYFAGSGTLQYFYNSNGGGWSTGIGGTSTALTYSNNDTIKLVIQRDNQHMSMTVENMSNGSAAARSIDIDIPITTGPIVPNTGRWAIYAQGGTFQVISLKCINNEVKTPNVLVLGDSKTMGFGATNYDSTVTGQLKKWYNGVAVSGGFGDKISDMLLRLPQLLAMQPKVVVLNSLGSNDIRFGRSVSDAMTDYATLRQAFVDIGATIVDVSPCYESAQSLSALNAAWQTTYGSLPNSINMFNLPRQYGLDGDGIHDNDATQKAWSKLLTDINVFEGAKN